MTTTWGSSISINMTPFDWLEPDWPAPECVRAVSTTRRGGVSSGAWATLNLGDHVGDSAAAVMENRRRLTGELDLNADPRWLTQVHGANVLRVEDSEACADASIASRPDNICVVMTADCLPVLFCNRSGTRVAAAHAGWRGLLAGVLEATLQHFDEPAANVLAWLGPAIGPDAFEVGEDVRNGYLSDDPDAAPAFRAHRPGHWLADIYSLAGRRLRAAGVEVISGGEHCTYSDPERFFSYRRDGITGRMASLIWLQTP